MAFANLLGYGHKVYVLWAECSANVSFADSTTGGDLERIF